MDYGTLTLSFENEKRLFLKTNITMQIAVAKAKTAMGVTSGTLGDGLGEEADDGCAVGDETGVGLEEGVGV